MILNIIILKHSYLTHHHIWDVNTAVEYYDKDDEQ